MDSESVECANCGRSLRLDQVRIGNRERTYCAVDLAECELRTDARHRRKQQLRIAAFKTAYWNDIARSYE